MTAGGIRHRLGKGGLEQVAESIAELARGWTYVTATEHARRVRPPVPDRPCVVVSDRFGESVVVLFEVDVAIKRHCDVAKQQPAARCDADTGVAQLEQSVVLENI